MSKALKHLLTAGEKDTLVECEKIIERGQQTFVEVGQALAQIRDNHLYRRDHPNFETYCQKRWGWSRPRAYQMMEASAAVQGLTKDLSTMVDNERTAREVAKIAPEKRESVVKAAAKTGRVTSKSVKAAAQEIAPKDKADKHGDQLPADVVADWNAAEELIKPHLQNLSDLACLLEKKVTNGERDKLFSEIPPATVADARLLRTTIEMVKPHAICPKCQGHQRNKCTFCRGRGFVSKFKWDNHTTIQERAMKGKGKRK